MHYVEIRPHPVLAALVRCYWVLRGGTEACDGGGAAALERVYPDGCAEVIFHRGERFAVAAGDGAERPGVGAGGFVRQPRALVFGQLERRIVLRRPARVETIGVRFAPTGLAPLLGVDAAELTGLWYALDEIAGRWTGGLLSRVLSAPDAGAAVRAIDATLAARAAAGLRRDAGVEGAVEAVRRAGGHIRVADLARSAGIGIRQLERRFHHQVGLSPKRFAGIMRLQAAFGLLAGPEAPSLLDVALRCGYFDQPHFIRDFRRVTGLPPSRFLRDGDGAMARLFLDS